jgi:peroxiredoxin
LANFLCTLNKNINFTAVRLLTIAIFLFINTFVYSQLEKGQFAPEIYLANKNGVKMSLNSLKGKVVLVDFWASWCMPCRIANVSLVNTYMKYNSKGFEIYSVSIDTERDLWLKAIEKDQMPWEYHVTDLLGWKSDVPTKYGVEAIPAAFLIDKNGVIVEIDISVEDLEQELDKLLNTPISFHPKNVSTKIYFTQFVKYEIVNEKGKSVLKGKGEEVDVEKLPDGIYTVNFANKTDKFLKKSNFAVITFYPQNVDKHINLSKESEFEIINTAGQIVMSGTKAQIDASTLKPGLYYLNIDGNTNKFLKK